MQSKTAQDTHKADCQMPSLAQVISQLKAENALITAELGAMPACQWPSERCRVLGNREQELYITLSVLEQMTQRPKAIEEPAAT